MPRHESVRHKLSHGWLRGEDYWGDPVSDNFTKIDMLMHPCVKSMTETTPPVNGLTIGDMYLVPVDAILAWEGHENDLAVFVDSGSESGWIFCKPQRGVRVRLDNPDSWMWFNGEGWYDESQNGIDAPAPQGTRYDVTVSVSYEAEPGEVLLVMPMPEAMTLPTGAVGSVGRSMGAPIGILRLVLKRNGSEIGTIVFAPNSVVAQFNVVGNKVFAAGDLLTLHMSETPPSGFQNYAVTMRLHLQQNGG